MPWVLFTSGFDKALSFRTGGLQPCVKMWLPGRKECVVYGRMWIGEVRMELLI